ncbi:hypothetical protein PHET_04046 [Paragonimus heterotremus]|uniref:Uncharacterized protein n=1 Tax=Paragonimus heterotremus TaxID=100268 RepID=A0A8J4T826_9TREM|nr:hypothetical protein PHET_04046 [Paragonimus heterotremus]
MRKADLHVIPKKESYRLMELRPKQRFEHRHLVRALDLVSPMALLQMSGGMTKELLTTSEVYPFVVVMKIRRTTGATLELITTPTFPCLALSSFEPQQSVCRGVNTQQYRGLSCIR